MAWSVAMQKKPALTHYYPPARTPMRARQKAELEIRLKFLHVPGFHVQESRIVALWRVRARPLSQSHFVSREEP